LRRRRHRADPYGGAWSADRNLPGSHRAALCGHGRRTEHARKSAGRAQGGFGSVAFFALPEIVLVVTGINGRASLSGAVPIMAVRQAR
jgi:hypothetical protein